jgi:hypothetical protein
LMTTPGETKVYHVAGFVFTADFDSGNLGGVALEEEREGEEVGEEEEEGGRGELITPTLRPSTSTLQVRILT